MIALTEKINGSGPVDTCLVLPYEQRTRSRLRVTLDDGREAGLFLNRGTVLRDGDLLVSEQGDRVMVKAALEKISIVRIEEPLLLAKVCYHLGNRHVPLQISENMICYQADHVLDEMVRAMGPEVHQDLARFEPESGAYSREGSHHHGHAH